LVKHASELSQIIIPNIEVFVLRAHYASNQRDVHEENTALFAPTILSHDICKMELLGRAEPGDTEDSGDFYLQACYNVCEFARSYLD